MIFLHPVKEGVLLKSLGERVRELRKRAGLSQQHLAAKLNVDQTYVSQIERGKIGLPSKEVLVPMAEILNTSVLELVEAAGYTETTEERELLPPLDYFEREYDVDRETAHQIKDLVEAYITLRKGRKEEGVA